MENTEIHQPPVQGRKRYMSTKDAHGEIGHRRRGKSRINSPATHSPNYSEATAGSKHHLAASEVGLLPQERGSCLPMRSP